MEEQTKHFDYDFMWQDEKPFADGLAYWIRHVIKPNKVFDIGCGPGMYVQALREQGVEAWGYDIDDRVVGRPWLSQISLFDLNDTADLVLCFEVAEHLPESMNDAIVDVMVRTLEHKGILIWTAAIPGQGGVGHINCQPKSVWFNQFVQAGLTPMIDLKNSMLGYIRQRRHMLWFGRNVHVFIKLGQI